MYTFKMKTSKNNPIHRFNVVNFTLLFERPRCVAFILACARSFLYALITLIMFKKASQLIGKK